MVAIQFIVLSGLGALAVAQAGADQTYANAEVKVTGNTPITCVETRLSTGKGYDMHVRCTATVSGIIKYIYPPNVRYRLGASIDNKGFGKKDLPVPVSPHNKVASGDSPIMATGTGKVTIPVSTEYDVAIESWTKKSDYCIAGSFQAVVGIEVVIPIGNDGEADYGDVRDVTVQVSCTGG